MDAGWGVEGDDGRCVAGEEGSGIREVIGWGARQRRIVQHERFGFDILLIVRGRASGHSERLIRGTRYMISSARVVREKYRVRTSENGSQGVDWVSMGLRTSTPSPWDEQPAGKENITVMRPPLFPVSRQGLIRFDRPRLTIEGIDAGGSSRCC